jgi:hypothetical protein
MTVTGSESEGVLRVRVKARVKRMRGEYMSDGALKS